MRDPITEKDKGGNYYLRMTPSRLLASFYINTHSHTENGVRLPSGYMCNMSQMTYEISCVDFGPLPKIIVSSYVCKYSISVFQTKDTVVVSSGVLLEEGPTAGGWLSGNSCDQGQAENLARILSCLPSPVPPSLSSHIRASDV